MPKFLKKRRQKASNRPVKKPPADKKSAAAAQTNITTTHTEAKDEPPVEKACHEQKISQPPGAKGTQKSEKYAAAPTNDQGRNEMPDGNEWRHHRVKRFQKEWYSRGSS